MLNHYRVSAQAFRRLSPDLALLVPGPPPAQVTYEQLGGQIRAELAQPFHQGLGNAWQPVRRQVHVGVTLRMHVPHAAVNRAVSIPQFDLLGRQEQARSTDLDGRIGRTL